MTTNNIDLLVLGGGINGTAIAKEAAERGLSVVLLEPQDLASATSSESSKLIHGGLRYLAQGAIGMVHESLHERQILLNNAPHLVKPLSFLMPTNHYGVKDWQIRIGLWLYDHLAKRGPLHKSYRINRESALLQPLLPDMTTAWCYQDCWGDDARLVVSNALAAKGKGATIYTYVGDYQLKRESSTWQVTLTQPEAVALRAKVVVNATGPWAAQVLEQSLGIVSPYRLCWVKGSHIVVPRFLPDNTAYTLPQPDGRIVFVIPYLQTYCMIGTTDVIYQGDLRAVDLDMAERDYLLAAVQRYFTVSPAVNDIVWHFSGVRPLIADHQSNPSKTSREYRFALDTKGAPILSVFGGKLTTHRHLAERAIHRCRTFFPKLGRSISSKTPLPGGDIPDWQVFVEDSQKRYAFIPEAMLQRYLHTYGTRIHLLLAHKHSLADLGRCFGADLYQHEVDFLRETEWAVTADDILWRRTKLGLTLTPAEQEALRIHIPK